jgi:hypothetical protein
MDAKTKKETPTIKRRFFIATGTLPGSNGLRQPVVLFSHQSV